MNDSPACYVVVGPVDVDNINLVQKDLVYGFPAPTAITGFGYKLVRDMNVEMGGSLLRHGGSAVIVHDYSVHEGFPKHSTPQTSKSCSDKTAPTMVEELKARARLTFVVRVESEGCEERGIAAYEPLDAVGTFLAGGRTAGLFGDSEAGRPRGTCSGVQFAATLWFQGGKCFPTATTRVASVDEDQLAQLLSRMHGHVLVDRRDVLEQADRAESDLLDVLIGLSELVPVDESRTRFRRNQKGWLVPVMVGFQGIEQPKVRRGQRQGDGNVKHVFAESLYSVAEFRSVRNFAATRDSPLDGALWKHEHVPRTSTYYATALPPIQD